MVAQWWKGISPPCPSGPPGAVTPAGDFSRDTPCPVPLALGSCLSGPLRSSRLTGHVGSILSGTHYRKGHVPLTRGLLTFLLLHRQLQLGQPQPYVRDALFYPQ